MHHAGRRPFVAGGRLPSRASTPARRVFERRLGSLELALARLDTAIVAGRASDARHAFDESRLAYKRVEALLTFYSPTASGTLNGPLEEGEADDAPRPLGSVAAFQQVERLLDRTGPRARADAHALTDRMSRAVRGLHGATPVLDVSDTAVLDAARLELARVATLGVAGGDGLERERGLVESATALDGARDVIDSLQASLDAARGVGVRRASVALDSASAFLRGADDYVTFDRLTFIAAFIRPAAERLAELRKAIDPATPASRRLWRATAPTPFDANAFDPWALAPEYAARSTAALVERGRELFNDPRLSGPGTRACGSCHLPGRAFTDGRTTALGLGSIDGRSHALRNTPTLLNAALQPALFADQRAGTLEDQARVVLTSVAEMGSSPERASARVGTDERTLRVALAAYLRSLVALDSRFDRAVRGDATAMTAGERHGFTIFMGKARCGTCHFAPLFDGTRPPDFTRSELEIIGVPARAQAHDATVDGDLGRAGVDGEPLHRRAFRVPSLRNVALTAPYMHNGVFRTLDDVVAFYDRGGGVGIGERLPLQTLPSTALHLTAGERRDLIAFLGALTDTVVIQHERVAQP